MCNAAYLPGFSPLQDRAGSFTMRTAAEADCAKTTGESMAGGTHQSGETMGTDFEEHLKTYHAFLRLLVYTGAATLATLLLLYFLLAR